MGSGSRERLQFVCSRWGAKGMMSHPPRMDLTRLTITAAADVAYPRSKWFVPKMVCNLQFAVLEGLITNMASERRLRSPSPAWGRWPRKIRPTGRGIWRVKRVPGTAIPSVPDLNFVHSRCTQTCSRASHTLCTVVPPPAGAHQVPRAFFHVQHRLPVFLRYREEHGVRRRHPQRLPRLRGGASEGDRWAGEHFSTILDEFGWFLTGFDDFWMVLDKFWRFLDGFGQVFDDFWMLLDDVIAEVNGLDELDCCRIVHGLVWCGLLCFAVCSGMAHVFFCCCTNELRA